MKKFIFQIKTACQNEIIRLVSVFALLAAIFGIVYFNLDRVISLDDPFFHVRFAEIFREQGIKSFTEFHWLYFSNISQNQTYFIYYNFLFYIALLPFTFIKPLVLGMKLYGVLFAALDFSLLYWFLTKIKEKRAAFWIVFALAFINYGVLMRFWMARPFTLAPVLLLLFLYFAQQKKYSIIFFLAVVYFYWHTATFFFPLIVVGAYFAFENFYGKRLDWKLIGAVLGGIILAFGVSLFFAPGLFTYMRDIIFGVFQDTIIGKKVNLAEGGELYPQNAVDFIKQNYFILIMFVLAAIFEVKEYVSFKKGEIQGVLDENSLTKKPLRSALFLLSLLFLLGTFISRRNADFFTFISFAYIVINFNYFIDQVKIENALVKKTLGGGIMAITVFFFGANLLFIHEQIASTEPYSHIEGAANWVKNNVPAEEIIFNATWNWFPTLFYYDSSHYYVAGIEPRFFYDYNSRMYWLWWNISSFGYVCDREKCPEMELAQRRSLADDAKKEKWIINQGNEISKIIRNVFGSRYIITSSSFARLNEIMDNNDNFERVFTDSVHNDFFVYKIK